MNQQLLDTTSDTLNKFINWLDNYGETSYDFHSFYASNVGRKAKRFYYNHPLLGIMAVAPMVFCEAVLPSARRLFWDKQRFPIADAHYAMGFAFLAQLYDDSKYYNRAVHFLKVLEKTRCPDYKHFCWGYPYFWETRKNGTIAENTPLITTTPYVYEAFKAVHEIDRNERWLEIMHSIAEHAIHDLKDFETSHNASKCSYTPFDEGGVINASAYRAFLLTSASVQFSDGKYSEIADRNINFVLQAQNSDGSWPYAVVKENDFVDHFHTCFVLKSLVKIEQLTGHEGCKKAIENGVEYYIKTLFDEKKLPKPFSDAPRFTVYRRELYNYAECINLGVLLKNRFNDLDKNIDIVLRDIFSCWQKKDGSFRSRKLFWGWDNMPMHRWAQAQMFRSLAFLIYENGRSQKPEVRRENKNIEN